MPRHIDLISTDPGIGKLNKPRLSIGQFNQLAQDYLRQIDKVKRALQHISSPFNGKGTILPVMCKEAQETLSDLGKQVEEFCELLDETSRLPLAILIHRHELQYECYQIIEQTRKLADLLQSYRVVCMSTPSSLQRKRIYDIFQELIQLISELSQRVEHQSEAARFQEQRLISVYEDALKS